jgi:hypothetical protein
MSRVVADGLEKALVVCRAWADVGRRRGCERSYVRLRPLDEQLELVAVGEVGAVVMTVPMDDDPPADDDAGPWAGGWWVDVGRLLAVVKRLRGDDVELGWKRAGLEVRWPDAVVDLPACREQDVPRSRTPRVVAVREQVSGAAAEGRRRLYVDGAALRDALAWVGAIRGSDRAELDQVCFEVKASGLLLVATDGHRVHRRAITARVEGPVDENGLEFGLDGRAVDALRRTLVSDVACVSVCGKADLIVESGRAVVEILGDSVSGHRFPDYRAVMIGTGGVHVSVSRTLLLRALVEGSALCQSKRERYNAIVALVRLGDDLVLRLSLYDKQGGIVRTVRGAEFSAGDAWPAVGFMPRYLVEALRGFTSDRVTLRGTAAFGSWEVRPEGDWGSDSSLAIVMPKRMD